MLAAPLVPILLWAGLSMDTLAEILLGTMCLGAALADYSEHGKIVMRGVNGALLCSAEPFEDPKILCCTSREQRKRVFLLVSRPSRLYHSSAEKDGARSSSPH